MTLKGANRGTRRKKWLIATSPSKNLTYTGLGSNPGLPQCMSYIEVTFRGMTSGGSFLLMVYIVPSDEITK